MMACRLCGGEGRVMLSLTPTPIANSFPDHPDTDAVRYPLELRECFQCGHVQLASWPTVDWVDYRYATPEAVRPHLTTAALRLRTRYPEAKTVVEIGSNNGMYLQELRRVGFDVLGVDPCVDCKSSVEIDGVPVAFSWQWARQHRPVDLIVANNVLAHVDDLQDVFAGIDALLTDDGALVFEVQYFPDLVRKAAFDMIYHEHRDYHTLPPLVQFLNRFGLVIVDWEYLETHGGSIRVYCKRPGISLEVPRTQIDWRRFALDIVAESDRLLYEVSHASSPVVAFGATGKASTLFSQMGGRGHIAYCVDNTPAKQGRYIAGTNIQIHPTSRLDQDRDATILLTAWNYEAVIRKQYPNHRYIVPFSHSRQEVST